MNKLHSILRNSNVQRCSQLNPILSRRNATRTYPFYTQNVIKYHSLKTCEGVLKQDNTCR
jgi:hypothetical protein